jgi:hypothetical protein
MTYKPSLKETIAHDLGEENEDVKPAGLWRTAIPFAVVIGGGLSVYYVDRIIELVGFVVK